MTKDSRLQALFVAVVPAPIHIAVLRRLRTRAACAFDVPSAHGPVRAAADKKRRLRTERERIYRRRMPRHLLYPLP